MAKKRDYYEVLGVDKGSDPKAIKKAYRNLAKKYHPDQNKEDGAAGKFKEVSEAYEVLSDESKKSAYDQYGHAATDGFSGFGGGGRPGGTPFDMGDLGDLGDIFGSFFGGGGGRVRQRGRVDNNGSDLRYKIRLDFMEGMKGGEYKINVQRDIHCNECEGSGSKDKKHKECDTCGGQGRVQRMQQSFLGQMAVVVECPECHGKGEIIENPCDACKGNGLTQESQEVKINVPAGAYDGMILRYTGSGSMGRKGGESGDLYIEISVGVDERFDRRGNDIYSVIDIGVDQAVLGEEMKVETIDGPVTLKIKPGTQAGDIFRIKDHGSAIPGRSARGDHYVQVNIEIPKKISRKQRKLWEELRSTK